MKSAVFYGRHDLRVEESPMPKVGPEDVLIQVKACGVCGTDVHIYEGDKGAAEVTPPTILGHEFSGVVAEVGENVTGYKPGDRVCIDPNCYCGKCDFCRGGIAHFCTDMIGYGTTVNGGFAEYCSVNQRQVYKLGDHTTFEQGAMTEPVACCLHGIDRAQIRTGDTVLVIGGGAIGLLMVQLAKLSGASQVLLSEPVQTRREIGLQLGANAAIDPIHEDLTARIRALTGMDGVDVVIECVGNTIATAQALSATKRGTTVLLFSVPKSGTTHPLSLEDVYQKELTIVGSIINPDTHQRAVDLINRGRIQLAPILTHRFPIERLKDAILMQMSSESLKVLVGSNYD